MFKLRTAARLSLTFGLIAAALAWLAINLQLIPNPNTLEIKNRIGLIKGFSLSVAAYAADNRSAQLQSLVERTVLSNENVQSISVIRNNQRKPVAKYGPHAELWDSDKTENTAQQLSIEVSRSKRPWGQVQIVYTPLSKLAFLGFPYGLIAFIGAATSLSSWWVMHKTFRYLNPANVVPGRVRSALDTLAEGLVLIDPNGEIAHANEAFASIVKRDADRIIGLKLDSFGWLDGEKEATSLPWNECRKTSERICGTIVELKLKNEETRKFVVNATPIVGEKSSSQRGVLASFDDVTELETKNTELAVMIETLRSSRDEISLQNEKLNFLVAFDPLTNCMNRRSFFEIFEQQWSDTELPHLAIIMLDVDHFKAVNDNHGHSVGDEVLKRTGALLLKVTGNRGVVCRFGGEEFIVLIAGVEFEGCVAIAEELRTSIENAGVPNISYTASFGVSSRSFGSMDPQHMLDQADESLYIAKNHGRNKVVRFDEMHKYSSADEVQSNSESSRQSPIAYGAVAGLLSALSFRCADTAQHSIRVADLCVAVGNRMMMKRSDVYMLEVAALLHDIGKIGVSDSILGKPGPLTEDEWNVMRKHDDIGVEIVRNAFACKTVTDAIESHHQCFTSNAKIGEPNQPREELPLAARIITVCDAFDAMTNDRVYRKAMTITDAALELTRNAPGQFDPEVVDKLLEYLQDTNAEAKVETVLPVVTDSRSAAAIGQHIEALQLAVESEDVESLKGIVEQLKHETQSPAQFTKVAGQLNEAVNDPNDDLDTVLRLADEVIAVCRSSRTAFVDAAEEIVNGNQE